MSLISLPPDYLELNRRLPFGVYDAFGRLLVAAGQTIDDDGKLALLRGRDLFVDEVEAGPLRDSLKASAGALIHHNATLEVIAAARLDAPRQAPRTPSHAPVARATPERPPAPRPMATRRTLAMAASAAPAAGQHASGVRLPRFDRDESLPQRCNALVAALCAALRDAATDRHWLARADAIQRELRDFTTYHRNAALYLLFQHAAHSSQQYSSHHALLCAVICDAVAASLSWADEARQRIVRAALTMNVSMSQLQDSLAMRDDPLRPVHRQQISSHAQRSADLLAHSGVEDESLLAIVRHHHDDVLLRSPLETLQPAQRLTRLLMSIDRFAARVSRRGSRNPMSPVLAARDLCNGENGRPDEFGASVLRIIGMYPPGSYVRLETGEIGVVLAPGRRMNQPVVAAFVNHHGMPTTEPLLRDTAQRGRAVVEAVPVAQVHVRVSAERALKLAP